MCCGGRRQDWLLAMPLERDEHFKANKTLGEYADDANEVGRIVPPPTAEPHREYHRQLRPDLLKTAPSPSPTSHARCYSPNNMPYTLK